jgi:RNA polymerase primary sigma factor
MSAGASHESSAIDRLLRVALSAGIETAVRAHIQRGGNIQGRDEKGWTALMIAASRDRAAICNILIDAGVAVGAVDGAGRDALSIAREFNALAAAELIARRATNPANSAAPRSVQGPSAPSPQPVAAESADKPDEVRLHHDRRIDVGAGVDHAATSEQLGLTFGDWEPLKESVPPTDLPQLADAERARQQRIDQHLPVDTAAEWEDFEAYLPEWARPLPRGDDDENRSVVRSLLLRALREGSIPHLAVENAMSARGDGEQRDEMAEAALATTIAAFGAELDEREEHSSNSPADDFEVFVDPVERDGEERAVEEALDYFDDLRLGKNEPLRLYFRSATKPQLLTAEQEVELASAMENAVERALDALANWPCGLTALIRAASGAGSRLGSIVQCGAVSMDEQAAESASDESDDATLAEESNPLGVGDDEEAEAAAVPEPEEPTGRDAPTVVLARLSLLVHGPSTEYREIRSELALLRFRRPYLLSLLDAARRDDHGAARDYVRAMEGLLTARDRMVSANLRLVMDLARRRLYLGIPLEDIIQEGNIGLVKAVDRFDWRRGFRFSTMATWWIKQQMGRGASDTALEIRVPTHAYEKMSKARRNIEAFERQRGEAASLTQQADIAGMDLRRFDLVARAFSAPMSVEDAESAGCFNTKHSDIAFDSTATKEVNALVGKLLAPLRRKDEEIVRQRFGIGVPEDRTLEEVGAAFGLTRERIRQIEAKLIKKFKLPDTMQRLSLALCRSESEGGSASFRHSDAPVNAARWTPVSVPPNGVGAAATRDSSDGDADEWCLDPDAVESAGLLRPGPAKGQP